MPQELSQRERDSFLGERFALVPAAAGGSGLRDRYRQPLAAIMVVVALEDYVGRNAHRDRAVN